MNLTLLYMEEGSNLGERPTLYVGYGLNFPVARWDGIRWHPYDPPEPGKDRRNVRLSQREAERCFPGSTTSVRPSNLPDEKDAPIEEIMRQRPELFDSYDFDYIRRSPDEVRESEERRPEWMKRLIAERKSKDDKG